MRRIAGLLALTAMVVVACRPDEQETGSISAEDVREARASLPPEVQMHLDSGNAAYRRKDYMAAREHYRAAAASDEDQPAAWFGLAMVHGAMGDSAAAAQAMEKARSLAPGATLIHPNGAAPRRAPAADTGERRSPHP